MGSLGSYLIDSNSSVTRDIIHIHNQEPKLLTFQNDYEIAYYLNAIEPVVSSTSELATRMTEPDIKYLSQKIKGKENKKNRSFNSINHYVAVSKPKKAKKKERIQG